MRKSVERRQHLQIHSQAKNNFLRRHLFVVIVIPILLLATAGALWYLHQKEVSGASARADAQTKRLAAIDVETKKAIQKKIDDARKAEAAAKKKAAEEEAKRKAAAAAAPSGAVSSTVKCDVIQPAKITVVVNKKHCFSPIGWAPNDLTSVGGYLLRAEAAAKLSAMMNAASAAGVGFSPSSTYRSYNDQVVTYNNWVAVNGSQAAADTVSARPGFSEHQTGLAVDLKAGSCVLECFANTAQYTWLTKNAAKYGFIQRYPNGLTSITGYSPEAWHWRYVGAATATDMKTKRIQTLEQYFGISGGDYA